MVHRSVRLLFRRLPPAEPPLAVNFIAQSALATAYFLAQPFPALDAVFPPLSASLAPREPSGPFPCAFARFLSILIQDARVLALQFAFAWQFLPSLIARQPPF